MSPGIIAEIVVVKSSKASGDVAGKVDSLALVVGG